MTSTAFTSHHTLASLATAMLFALLTLAVCSSLVAVLSALFSFFLARKAWFILLVFLVPRDALAFLARLAHTSLVLAVRLAGLMVSVFGVVLILVVGAIRLALQLVTTCVRYVAVPCAHRACHLGASWTRRSASRLARMMDMADNVSMSISSRLSATDVYDGSVLRPNFGLRRRRRFADFIADSMVTTVASVGRHASRLGQCALESVGSLPSLDPTEFPAFSYIKRLGNGSSGKVFLAHTVGQFSELKAIKVITKYWDTPIKTLQNEVLIQSFLSKSYGGQCHPNIARLDHVKETDTSVSIIMEYCSRGTMSDLFRRAPDMVASDAAVARTLLPVAQAVAHMHRHGIGHRDLKMSNILVDGQGTLKVADFGLATRDRVCSDCVGTTMTMAPEVFASGDQGTPYSPRPVDIWALGVIFWQLKFRSLPWEMADVNCSSGFRSYLGNQYVFLADQRGMTAATVELALRLLSPDPAMRANADEAVEILQSMAMAR